MAPSTLFSFCILIVGVLADPNSGKNVNHFMDFVFEHRLPNYVKSLNIDPIQLSPFSIHLPKNAFFKADLENGTLHGLSKALRRRGDCGHTAWHGANLTCECYLHLEGLSVSYDGVARGLDELDSRTNFKLDVTAQSTAFVEVTGQPGQHAMLKDRDFGKLQFEMTVNKMFGLNNWRMEQFKEIVDEHLKHSLLRILFSSFTHALRQSFATVSIPVQTVETQQ